MKQTTEDFLVKRVIVALSTLMVAPAAVADYYFVVDNECHSPAAVYVRYQDMNGGWRTSGRYTIAPGEGAFLARDNDRLRSRNPTFYFYAEVIGTGYSWRGSADERKDRTYTIGGIGKRRFRHKRDTWWDNDVVLGCSNLEPPPRVSAGLFAMLKVASRRHDLGRQAAADDLVTSLSTRQADGFVGLDPAAFASIESGMTNPDRCPFDLTAPECKIVRATVSNERFKDQIASLLGLGAGASCAIGVSWIPGAGLLAAVPAAIACNILVNSATRTAFNCAISATERSMIRRVTGRDSTGCFEIGFRIEGLF